MLAPWRSTDQVSRYRSIMACDGHVVTAVLVPGRPAKGPSWQALCDELDVPLASVPDFAALMLGDT